MKERDKFWDAVKGLAIVFVVLGHAIQFGGGKEYLIELEYWNSAAMRLIYSFHMPLFMLVSGYFCYFSCRKHNALENIKNKLKKLLIPIVSFSIIKVLVVNADSIDNLMTIDLWWNTFANNLWFLWVILISSLMIIILGRIKSPLVYLILMISCILFLFLPNKWVLHYLAWLFPYFIIGYIMNERHLDKLMFDRIKIILPVCLILFVSLLVFYNIDSFIYTSGTDIYKGAFSFSQLIIDVFRFCIGLVGSISVILIIKLLYEHMSLRVLPTLGLYSIGIYCFQDTVLRIWYHLSRNWASPNIACFGIAFIVIMVTTFLLAYYTMNNKFTNRILFGGR